MARSTSSTASASPTSAEPPSADALLYALPRVSLEQAELLAGGVQDAVDVACEAVTGPELFRDGFPDDLARLRARLDLLEAVYEAVMVDRAIPDDKEEAP